MSIPIRIPRSARAPETCVRPVAPESWLLAGLCTADLLFTVWLVVTGRATEANPVLRFYLDSGLLPFVAAKLLLFGGPLFVLERLRRRRPVFIRSLLRFGIVLYLLCYGLGVWTVNGHGGGLPTALAASAPN